MTSEQTRPTGSGRLGERRGRGRVTTVILYSVAAAFLVTALALMTQWLISDPIGGPWLLAGLLSVGGAALLVASVRDAQAGDDADQ